MPQRNKLNLHNKSLAQSKYLIHSFLYPFVGSFTKHELSVYAVPDIKCIMEVMGEGLSVAMNLNKWRQDYLGK